jgi:hypothetical protein
VSGSAPVTLAALAAEENLVLAAEKARRNKNRRPDVQAFMLRLPENLAQLRAELVSETWRPAGYHTFMIHRPKTREIAAAPFRDRVVHHALCNLLAPVLEKSFIARSFSCQIGKGTTAARECVRKLVNRHDYVLKCDVRKFFPSIDHGILYEKLASRVSCPGVRNIIQCVLNSHASGPEVPVHFFPGDDLLTQAARPRGLPIGNLTSQLWGNFLLDGLDHWITEGMGFGGYARYTDDFLIFASDKLSLWEMHQGVKKHLAGLRMTLAEPKSRLLACREGVPFCGFRFLPGLRPRILGSTKRRFESRARQLRKARDFQALSTTVYSFYQFSREGNAEGMRRAYARPHRQPPAGVAAREDVPGAARRVVEQRP